MGRARVRVRAFRSSRRAADYLEYEMPENVFACTIKHDYVLFEPPPGKQPHQPNTLIAYPDTPRERRVSTKRVPVEPGDGFRVLSAGGGGRGDPGTREPERVREDVLDGFVSEQAAREVYGVDPATWQRLP